MSIAEKFLVQRWTPLSIIAVVCVVALIVALAFGPFYLSPYLTDRFTTLFIYVLMAATWNALAGYGGLVSVGHQMFFGLGAYAAVRLSYWGVNRTRHFFWAPSSSVLSPYRYRRSRCAYAAANLPSARGCWPSWLTCS